MKIKSLLASCLFFSVLLESCGQNANINPEGTTISTRILPPPSYEYNMQAANSFGHYLANLKLKPHGTKVKYYNGFVKPNFWVYVAVVDMDVGNRDLQQCADAIMRLRGEYLYQTKQYGKIHFNFTRLPSIHFE